jgi:hypothetical protein
VKTFHHCAIRPAGEFVRFTTIETGGVKRRIGYRKDGTSEVQGVLYDARTWSPGRARHHCDAKGGTFEPAAEVPATDPAERVAK